MATITKTNVGNLDPFSGVPYGNLTIKNFSMATDASGIFTDSNGASAVAIGDVLQIGLLPEGMTLHDAKILVSAAFTALTTANIGFAYVDGVDDADVPQDADYFGAAVAMSAAARLDASNNAVVPVRLPKDAYLILTWAGAINAVAGQVNVLVNGVL